MCNSNIESTYLNMLVQMHCQEKLTSECAVSIVKNVLVPLEDKEVQELIAYCEEQYQLIKRGEIPASPKNLPLLEEALTFLRSLHF
jgi:hypothetical protein